MTGTSSATTLSEFLILPSSLPDDIFMKDSSFALSPSGQSYKLVGPHVGPKFSSANFLRSS